MEHVVFIYITIINIHIQRIYLIMISQKIIIVFNLKKNFKNGGIINRLISQKNYSNLYQNLINNFH